MWLKDILGRSVQPDTGSGSTYLIVGLGNPGREYRQTRHNVGFMAVDRLGETLSIKTMRVQSKALVGTGKLDDHRIILVKPQTFMNLSGDAVSTLVRFYKVPLEQIIVIHDDLDLPLGTIRIRPSGGSAGQKGLGSIIQKLGTQEFPRVRIGIGRPPGQMAAADYVLQDFHGDEPQILTTVLDRVVQAVQVFTRNGLEMAMNQFNGALDKG